MTILQEISPAVNAHVRVNENFDSLAVAALYAKDFATTTGLTLGYIGGIFLGNTVSNGTVALTDNATNYVVALRSSGAVSASTATTNWNSAAYVRLHKVVTASGVQSSIEDHRCDINGLYGGPGLPITSHSADYTFVLADANTGHLHPSADTTARTWTIPANASVAYPVGTAITIINQASGGNISIGITTDTMRLAGAGTTGTRTLTANGIATAVKITSTEWLIVGTNLS